MNFNKKIIILFLICKGAWAFDLIEAYKKALRYNADYLSIIAQSDADQELVKQARSKLFPQMNLTASLSENYLNFAGGTVNGLPALKGGDVLFHQPLANFTINQPLFDYSVFTTYTKNKYKYEIAKLTLENEKQNLITTVAKSYFELLYQIESVEITSLSKNSFEQQYKNALKSFDAGNVTMADVNDAKFSYDSSIASEIASQNELLNKKNILNNITGLDSDLIQGLISEIDLVEPSPNNLESWVNFAKLNNMSIKIAKKEADMAYEDIKVSNSGHIPTLYLTGNINYQGNIGADVSNPAFNAAVSIPGGSYSEQTTAAIQLNLTVPIFSGGNINSQVRQAANLFEMKRQKFISKQREVEQLIKNAFWQVSNGVRIVKARLVALNSAKLKLKSDKLGYSVGIRNSINLVDAQKNYADSLQSYNLARYQYLLYHLQLQYLAGKMDEDFLKIINKNIVSSYIKNDKK